MNKKIETALISVYHKDGLDEIINLLHKHGVKIISTGGTADFIKKLNVPVTLVESITRFPALFGGRVKTLQPEIFGGILNRRDNATDQKEKEEHKIEDIDLVIVDLYPFEETLESGAKDEEIIEKIDIGGISLIRAAAKNFNDVVVIPSKNQYGKLNQILKSGNSTTLAERKDFAGDAFFISSSYDTAIRGYFEGATLRYGENPHQKGKFIGQIEEIFDQLHGKEMSYNNFLDTESAVNLVLDIEKPAFAIIKHLNSCGLATSNEGKLIEAFNKAYTADPKSAFGGILASNRKVTKEIAERIKETKLFVEVIIAPQFEEEALDILKQKQDIRILKYKNPVLPKYQIRTCFTGLLSQERDTHVETEIDLKVVSKRIPTENEKVDLLLAAIAAKHLKSNCVAFVKNGQLITMGSGQTSRVDALENALKKAKEFGFDITGSVIASEAFLPFPDCVEIAGGAGATAVIHPGGSKNDQASIDKADELGMAMVLTGFRHFKH